jgi:hypothetical protein
VVTNDMPAVPSQVGHELVVHTVVTGGQALLDTLNGVSQLVRQLDGVRFVVWLNPFWGPIADDGKTFEQMKTYQDVKKRIETVVNMPAFSDELFPQDIAAMLKGRLTFKDAIEIAGPQPDESPPQSMRPSSMWLFGRLPPEPVRAVELPPAPRSGRPQRCSARPPRGARRCYPELPEVRR